MSQTTLVSSLEPAAELRQIRLALRLSQRKFSRLLGVHHVTLNRWEHAFYPVPHVALHLARALSERQTQDATTPPAPYVLPMADAVGIQLEPAEACAWAHLGDCAEACFQFQATVDTRHYLQGEACTTHLYQLYDVLIVRLRAEVRKRAVHRKAALKHARRRYAEQKAAKRR